MRGSLCSVLPSQDARVFGWLRDSAFGPPDRLSSGWEQLRLEVRSPEGSADGTWRVELTDTTPESAAKSPGWRALGRFSFDAGAPGAQAFAASR